MKRLFSFLFVLAGFVSCMPGEDPATDPTQPHVDEPRIATDAVQGMMRVKLKSGLSAQEVLHDFGAQFDLLSVQRTFPECGVFEARTRAEGLHLWYDLQFNPEVPLTKAYVNLQGNDHIAVVEPVQTYKVLAEEAPYPFNDPGLPSQWNYYNPGTKLNYAAGCDINLFPAWEITTGRREVVVAVADDGLDVRHEDLRDNLWVNEAEQNGQSGVDDDGNGYVDDVYGYNFNLDGRGGMVGTVTPSLHGDNVAGIIGAVNHNGLGYCGIAGGNGSGNGVRLMACQIISDSKEGAYVERAIKYAADNGAVIINNSWGNTEGNESVSQALVEVVNYFTKYAGLDASGKQVGPMAGGLVVFSAGNDNAPVAYPVSRLPKAFAVAAVGAQYKKASYSNYGDWVDISAPGGDYSSPTAWIYSLGVTGKENGYSQMVGTSQAAPHVSGVAALVVSHFGGPGFTVEMLKEILRRSVKPLDNYQPAYAGKMGAGLVNAYNSLIPSGMLPKLRAEDLELTSYANSLTLMFEAAEAASIMLFGYDIYYSSRSLASLSLIEELPGDVQRVRVYRDEAKPTACVFEGLEFGQTYYFRVEGFDRYNRSTGLTAERSARTESENNVPTLTPLDGTSVTVRAHETRQLRFTMEDADGHPLQVDFDPGSGAATLEVEENLVTLTFNGMEAPAGDYVATLAVRDPYSSSEPLEITYSLLENHAPVAVQALPNQVFSAKNEKLSLNLAEYFNDPDGEELSYTVISSAAVRVVEATAYFSDLSLKALAYGSTFMSVTASDLKGEKVTSTFEVLVRDGSRPVDLYPNPVHDRLYLRTSQSRELQVRITSASGAEVYASSLVAAPFAPASIEAAAWPAGTYTVTLEAEGTQTTQRIVKY